MINDVTGLSSCPHWREQHAPVLTGQSIYCNEKQNIEYGYRLCSVWLTTTNIHITEYGMCMAHTNTHQLAPTPTLIFKQNVQMAMHFCMHFTKQTRVIPTPRNCGWVARGIWISLSLSLSLSVQMAQC